MKAHYKLVLLIIFACIGLYLFQRNLILKERFQESQALIEVCNHNTITYESLIFRSMKELKQIDLTNTPLEVLDSNGKKIDFRLVIENSKKLIFRFKEASCSDCLADQILKLKHIFEVLGPNSVILLVSYDQNKNLKAIKETYSIPFPIYNIDSHLIVDWPYEKYIEPYYFKSETKKLSDFFIPDKTLEEFNDRYLTMVLQDL